MRKYFVTGFSGFVAMHFVDFLRSRHEESEVLGVDLSPPMQTVDLPGSIKCTFERMNLLDREKVESLLGKFQPNFIVHLASFSSVAYSWKEPVQSFLNNTNIFLNLVEAVRKLNLKTRILSVGSSEEYGKVRPEELPLTEESRLKPGSPYGVARVAQEMLSKMYWEGFGVDIVLTRSFNHFGPGQKEIFVVPSIAWQIVQIKRRKSAKKEICVGNLDVIRDFVDVRDVVSAYHSLLAQGKAGEVYNVCSGKGVKIRKIVEEFSRLLQIEVEAVPQKELFRPNENDSIVGSPQKINKETGWEPKIPQEKSLKDILEFWSQQG